MMALAPLLFGQFKLYLGRQLSFDARTITQPTEMLQRLQDMVGIGLLGAAVFGLIVAAAAMLSTVAAGGWVASLKPVMPDFSRANPLTGFGRLFTKDRLSDVLKMVVLTVVLLALGTVYLSSSLGALAMLVLQPSTAALQYVADWLIRGMGLMLLVILLLALVDVPLQNFLHKSRLKMSHQEVKQEHKESDGNPQLKSKQRQRQREAAQGNSIAAVPKADFVLMNPSHFAVAIRYDEASMRAPQVVSKGADLLAMRIRDLAKQNAIPVLQSPMLARALYANAELDQDIPASLYTAVAQVMVYIYRLKAALRGDGPMPGEPPLPFVPPELDPLSRVIAARNPP